MNPTEVASTELRLTLHEWIAVRAEVMAAMRASGDKRSATVQAAAAERMMLSGLIDLAGIASKLNEEAL